MAGLSKLEAVNRMLGIAGEMPVSSLDTTDPDMANAVRILDRVDSQIQSQGWMCNREGKYTFYPSTTGEIPIPASMLTVTPDGEHKRRKITRRGNRLYDKETHSYQFSGPISCEIVTQLDFDDLPPKLKDYIAAQACRDFQQEVRGAVLGDQFSTESINRARIEALSEDGQEENLNWQNTSDVRHIAGGRNRTYLDE